MQNAAQSAISNVRECGAQMGASAHALRAALPGVRMNEAERDRTLELCEQFSAVSSEVASGVTGLDTISATSEDEIREVLLTLSTLESQMMQVLVGSSLLVDSLEQSAERDAADASAYVIVVERVAALLQSFEKAKSATEALRAALNGCHQ